MTREEVLTARNELVINKLYLRKFDTSELNNFPNPKFYMQIKSSRFQ